MPATPPRRQVSAVALFWWQVLLGVGIGVGLLVIVGVLASIAPTGAPAVAWAPAILGWVALGVAGLWALERRKPAPLPAPGPAWNAHVRELRSSRLEIVHAFEIERRRIERDLHDGAQQHLVASSLQIGEAVLLLSQDAEQGRGGRGAVALDLLERAQDATDAALAALRATVAGIHPAVLSDLGLEAAARDLAQRCPVAVDVRVPHPLPALPEPVAAAAYFLVAEALTNVAKHAPDARATVLLACDDDLRVSVVDDGPGGAVVRPGHGLAGMAERLAAFGGRLQVSSPEGGPTSLGAHLPLLLGEGELGICELSGSPVGGTRVVGTRVVGSGAGGTGVVDTGVVGTGVVGTGVGGTHIVGSSVGGSGAGGSGAVGSGAVGSGVGGSVVSSAGVGDTPADDATGGPGR